MPHGHQTLFKFLMAMMYNLLRLNTLQAFTDYFKEVEEESIRDNFVIVYELLDEFMDFGYPQTTDPKVLQEYVLLILSYLSSYCYDMYIVSGDFFQFSWYNMKIPPHYLLLTLFTQVYHTRCAQDGGSAASSPNCN